MHPPRSTIASLLFVISAFGIGLAALKENDLQGIGLSMLMIIGLLGAAFGAAPTRAPSRTGKRRRRRMGGGDRRRSEFCPRDNSKPAFHIESASDDARWSQHVNVFQAPRTFRRMNLKSSGGFSIPAKNAMDRQARIFDAENSGRKCGRVHRT